MPAQAKRLFYGVLIASLCLIALIAIAAILGGDFGETEARVVGTVLGIAVYSATSFAQVPLLERRPDLAWLAWCGIAASAIGFVVVVSAIWSESDSSGTWRSATIFLVIAVSLANTAVLISRRRPGDGPAVRMVLGLTIGAVATLALLLIAELSEHGTHGESFYRLLGVVAVLWVLGMLLLPILRKAEATQRHGQSD
jgi:hypothetical protein